MASNDSLQRSVLPIPDRRPVTLTTYDAKDPDTKFLPITPLRPPTGAPNVLVILLDDVGFGASSAFGGPYQTPAERLAKEGLKYNRSVSTRGRLRLVGVKLWPSELRTEVLRDRGRFE
jgi:Sulfatase